jgi:hypothetical protein
MQTNTNNTKCQKFGKPLLLINYTSLITGYKNKMQTIDEKISALTPLPANYTD